VAVECGENSAIAVREAEQRNVRDVTMAGDVGGVEYLRVEQGDAVRPKLVLTISAELRKVPKRFCRPDESVLSGLLRSHPQETAYRHRAGGPPARPLVLEPVMRDVVMDVIRKEQGDQNIYIE
jgi:hypothetical protein